MVGRTGYCLALLALWSGAARSETPPVFDKDVLPLLKAHCFACHGVDGPKGNLDLRTRAGLLKGGKTVPAVTPGSLRDSLLWTNIANDRMPLEGNKLNDAQKQTLRRWILAGAPASAADVVRKPDDSTGPAVKRGVAAVSRRIDQLIDAQLRDARVPASPQADDAEFLRRSYLDLIGRIPTLEQTSAFLDSKDHDKRAKLIEELLARPDYGRHFAVVWHKLLLPRTAEIYRNVDHDAFRAWLAEGFNRNRGWNDTVTALLTASGAMPTRDKGNQSKKEPVVPMRAEAAYTAIHFEDGRPQPRSLAASSSKLFLGVQIECAQCHHHPLARWQQEDFWGVAAFFERVRGPGFKPGVVLEPATGKEQIYNDKGRYYRIPAVRAEPLIDVEDQGNKPTGKLVRARFLGGAQPKMNPHESYRAVYARWLTAADNPYFARAAVNRLWFHLFGRGLVAPVDDMQEDNAPTHPRLLAELASEFAAAGFDLKHLLRCITNSQAYQRGSSARKDNVDDKTLLSHQGFKLMTAEVLLEALSVAVPALAAQRAEKPVASGKNKGKTSFSEAEFLTVFESDESAPTEQSRGLIQALRLMNRDGLLFQRGNMKHVLEEGATAERNVERIYLTVLNRRPTAAELKTMLAFVNTPPQSGGVKSSSRKGKGPTDPPDAYADIYWALLNSSEFIFNH